MVRIVKGSLLFLILDSTSKGFSSVGSIANNLRQLHSEIEEDLVRRKLEYAYHQGYLKRYGDTSHPHYQLSPRGEKRLAQLRFKNLKFDPRAWDRQWRILIFDIPESQRYQRDMLRRLVKELGMQRLQRSVWVTPADCRHEFEQLKVVFGLENNLLLLECRNLPELDYLKSFWEV